MMTKKSKRRLRVKIGTHSYTGFPVLDDLLAEGLPPGERMSLPGLHSRIAECQYSASMKRILGALEHGKSCRNGKV